MGQTANASGDGASPGVFLRAFALGGARLSVAQKAVLLGALALCAVAFLRSLADVRQYAGIDLRNRVVGARVLLEGRDPYTFFWQPGLPEELLDPVHDWKVHRLTVPPTTLWLYAPLAPLPYRAIRVISCLLEWAALLASVALLVRLVPGTRARVLFLGGAALFFAFGDFWRMHLERGQVYVFHLLALSAGAYWCARRNLDSWAAGLAFGVAAAMRPNLALLAPAFLVLGKWRTGAGTALTTGVAVLASALVSPPGTWQSYLRVGNTYYVSIWAPETLPDVSPPQFSGDVEGYNFAAHLNDVCSTSFAVLYEQARTLTGLPRIDLGAVSKLLMLLLGVGLLALLWSRRGGAASRRLALALILVVAIDVEFFLPHRWAYVDVMLLLPLALLMPLLLRPSARGVAAGGVVLLALVAGHSLSPYLSLYAASLLRSYGVLGGLSVWAVWLWARRRRATAPRALPMATAASARGGAM